MTDPAILRRLQERAESRASESYARLLAFLRARGHRAAVHDDGGLTLDGIPVPLQMRPADPATTTGSWVPTDRTFVQVGSMAFGHIWWATEPVQGFDFEALVGQVEGFLRVRRAQLKHQAVHLIQQRRTPERRAALSGLIDQLAGVSGGHHV